MVFDKFKEKKRPLKMEEVGQNVYKFIGISNCYLLDIGEKILIDSGHENDRDELIKALEGVVNIDDIDKVIYTHLHYDHIGNFEVFKNSELLASEKAIKCLGNDPYGTVLDKNLAQKILKANLKPVVIDKDLFIIETPGHTKGSICIWYPKESILFSGDTIFYKGYGRTDLPTSDSDKFRRSIKKLSRFNIKILCPGHEY